MITIRPLLTLIAIAAFAAPAFAGPMINAERLTQQAHGLLKNDATSDKGGHRVKAMRLLKEALDEIKAGIEFDKQNASPNENKKGKRK